MILDDMTPEDTAPKSFLVANLALVLAQNLPSFSKSLIPRAPQLQKTSSNPEHNLATSSCSSQQGAIHQKKSLEIPSLLHLHILSANIKSFNVMLVVHEVT